MLAENGMPPHSGINAIIGLSITFGIVAFCFLVAWILSRRD